MAFSSRAYGTRTFSMYGGSGGQGTRISTSRHRSPFGSICSLSDGLDLNISINEKATMQNLNDRLASYMQNVQSLEKKNAELENKIREWYECHTFVFRDHSDFLAKVKDLRDQMQYISKYNAKSILDIDNASLTADDFKTKYEAEQSMRMTSEADTAYFRKAIDEMSLTRSDLEMQYESLKEELVMLEKNYEEEMAQIREQAGQVNVSVDAAPSKDLNQSLLAVRQHYEAMTARNNSDLEAWYQSKISTVEQEVDTHSEELKYSRTELKELKSTFQRLQVEIQTHHSMRASNEETLAEVEAQYSEQLAKLQRTINDLEVKLSDIHTELTINKTEYDILLDLKDHLQNEIREYTQLLEGNNSEQEIYKKTIENGKVVETIETVITEEIDNFELEAEFF